MKPDDFLAKTEYSGPVADGEASIKWFGTAAYRIEYGGKVLWIDPWFSRQGPLTLLAKPLNPIPGEIDPYMDRADYIVIGHSHYDHAADLPYIVPKTGAVVAGSGSTSNILRAAGVKETQIKTVTGGDSLELGPFKVSFIRQVHGKIFGRIPADFDIPASVKLPLKAKEYGHGEVFGILIEVGGLKIYHQGSAGLIEETIQGVKADIVLLGISSRSATPKFVYRVVKTIQPTILIPMHYDYFFQPLGKGFRMIPTMKFGDAIAEARDAKPDVKIMTLPLLGEYRAKVK